MHGNWGGGGWFDWLLKERRGDGNVHMSRRVGRQYRIWVKSGDERDEGLGCGNVGLGELLILLRVDCNRRSGLDLLHGGHGLRVCGRGDHGAPPRREGEDGGVEMNGREKEGRVKRGDRSEEKT